VEKFFPTGKRRIADPGARRRQRRDNFNRHNPLSELGSCGSDGTGIAETRGAPAAQPGASFHLAHPAARPAKPNFATILFLPNQTQRPSSVSGPSLVIVTNQAVDRSDARTL
jgi:hypothetical protein